MIGESEGLRHESSQGRVMVKAQNKRNADVERRRRSDIGLSQSLPFQRKL